jgi:hypothetical protein
MKVEIAESLIFSWLRHVQGCAVVQMNWKPSPSWTVSNEDRLREDFEGIRRFASESVGVPIFKKCDFAQFVRQTEIDVLGLRLSADPAAMQVFAVDSAFHEGGLLYVSSDETVGRVLKKLIRATLAIEAYLSVGEATIAFATPKMAEPIRSAIEGHLANLEAVIADRASAGFVPRFRIIANSDFVGEILQPVLDQANRVADTSELFLRAHQLRALCDRPVRQQRSTQMPAKRADRGEGIGAHVRATMTELATSGRLTPEVVSELSSADYSKMQFNLSLPFLKRVDPAADLRSQRRDHNNWDRYWKEPLVVGGTEFLMFSQWYEDKRKTFDQWVRDLGQPETGT